VTNLVVTKLAARHTFLINSEGIIVREFLDVNPSEHSQEVLAAPTPLQSSSPNRRATKYERTNLLATQPQSREVNVNEIVFDSLGPIATV